MKIWIAAAALALAGCATPSMEARANQAALSKLNVGDSRAKVIESLGQPAKRNMYGEEEHLLYYTNVMGQTERTAYTPVVIKDGRVVGWGSNYFR